MRIVLTFGLNAGLNLLLSLALAGALGPEAFGRFAVASVAVIVLGTAAFEWLRLSATRFVTPAEAAGGEPAIRASLELGYILASLPLVAGGALVVAIGLELGLGPLTLALVTIAAVANARFEYAAALARALFLDRAYLRLIIIRNVLSLGLMVGAALLARDANWVLAMLALSSALGALAVRGSLRSPARLAGASRERLLAFARYGLPIVAANLVYQGIVLLNRSVAGARGGFEEAGQISLPTDLTVRLLLSAGAALDAYLFQLAVRRRAEAGEAAGDAAVARNMTLVAAALLLLALIWVSALPAFTSLLVPARYGGDFATLAAILTPGVLAFCLVQFALSPVFQLSGRTTAVLWTALAALAADLALLMTLPASVGTAAIAAAHSASLVAASLVAAALARRLPGCWPPLRDGVALMVAAVIAAAAMVPARAIGQPLGALAWTICAGVPVFAAVLVAFDAGGLRRLASRLAEWAHGRPVSKNVVEAGR